MQMIVGMVKRFTGPLRIKSSHVNSHLGCRMGHRPQVRNLAKRPTPASRLFA
jgi:hypothetical protein